MCYSFLCVFVTLPCEELEFFSVHNAESGLHFEKFCNETIRRFKKIKLTDNSRFQIYYNI